MNVQIGEVYIRGDLINVGKFFIRIEEIKRSKIRIASYNTDRVSFVDTTDKDLMKRLGKSAKYANTHWVRYPGWISIELLKLIAPATEDLLEL